MHRTAWIALLLACLPPALAGAPSAFEHDDLDAILKATVRGEGVDYAAVRDRHLPALVGYLNRAAAFDAAGLGRDERLAFLINVYNATMIRAVVERLTPQYTAAEDDWGVFDERLVRLGGQRMSLNQLEHRIIRPEFGDPRIHAALVCAAESCPPLIPRAYRADDLDAVLEANMRRFVNDPSRNTIDVAGQRLVLSRIFEWYAEDFGGKDGLTAYVDRYTEQRVAGFAVTHRRYSWKLNRVR